MLNISQDTTAMKRVRVASIHLKLFAMIKTKYNSEKVKYEAI